MLIIEQRRNGGLVPGVDETEKLVSNLVRQAPNRIYYSREGNVYRVLFFPEPRRLYQAYMETAKYADGIWVPTKSEWVSAISPEDLEMILERRRRQLGMAGDLLGQPHEIFRVSGSGFNGGSFVHLGNNRGKDPAVFCAYSISFSAPGISELGLGRPKLNPGEILTPTTYPRELFDYIHPFR